MQTPSDSDCPQPVNVTAAAANAVLNETGLNVIWDFPNVFGDTGGTPVNVNCKFVNSFVIRVSTTYQTSTGQSQTYYLTAGYHDKDVR